MSIQPISSLGQSAQPPEVKNRWKEAFSKIWEVAKKIFIALVGIALFVINSTLFAIGFVAGMLFHKQTRELMNKIQLIWDQRKWAIVLAVAAAAVLSLHVTLAVSATLFAAHFGSRVAELALAKKNSVVSL